MPRRNLPLVPTLAALLLVAVLAGCAGRLEPESPTAAPDAVPHEESLILISLDGFRWDYLDRVEVPHLTALAARGVRAEGLIPVYPSKTFPCHYSVVTGLYPGHHGILFNDIYDAEFDAEFHLRDRDAVTDPRWWGGEPIWVTAERQGVRAGAMFWPGTEGAIGGVRPSYWRPYDSRFSYRDRVDTVLGWLDLPPGERPRMMTLYFQTPDGPSHHHGPLSPQAFAAAREVDARIGDLVAGIERRGLTDRVNLIVVSDHGMAETSRERAIILDDYVELAPEEVFQDGAVLQLHPRPGREEEIFAALDGAHPRLAVYRRGETPERYHLGSGPRVPPILGVPDAGWQVKTRRRAESLRAVGGDHGYDPADPSMHALFVAAGPALRSGLRVERFESVEIYNLMCAILGLDPAANDGRPGALDHLLAD